MSGKKYVVVYTRNVSNKHLIERMKENKSLQPKYKDYVKYFVDGVMNENKINANNFYDNLIQDGRTYSASICKIKTSTDY